MTALTARTPVTPADICREVLAGEGEANDIEDGRGAFKDDPVGVRQHRPAMLDADDRIAGADEPVDQVR